MHIVCGIAAKIRWAKDQPTRSIDTQIEFTQGEMRQQFIEYPLDPLSENRILTRGTKTNLKEQLEEAILGPPILAWWYKV